ncbi:MAG: uracil-DNA glycosylase [Deltaproteobacteria bacterium]|nr:uracil-DNA glycosylase [Deltaproteobacteria bacterium]
MTTKGDHPPEDASRITCRRCRHYYVTWDKAFPHGCRAMGFKSRESPAKTVQASSGLDCLLFEGKEKKDVS